MVQDAAAPSARFATATVLCALVVATLTWPCHVLDVETFLLPWLAHIRAAGPVGAFAAPFANYTPPYLYLLALSSPLVSLLPAASVLKSLSFACSALLGVAVARLLHAAGFAGAGRGALLTVLAPSLFVSPALLVQSDALWAAAIVLALTAAVERRHAAMFVWCGLGVVIKLQAGFAGPFFLALALARQLPVRLWLLAPAAAGAALLPAWMAGWPLGDLLTIYVRQAQWGDGLVLNAPNIWMVFQSLPWFPRSDVVAWFSALTAVASYVALFRRRLASCGPAALIRAACLCVLIVPGLLPRMHERYFFLSDVLALVLSLLSRADRRLVMFTQLGSVLAILAYLSGIAGLAAIGAAAMLVATWYVIEPMLPDDRLARRHLALF